MYRTLPVYVLAVILGVGFLGCPPEQEATVPDLSGMTESAAGVALAAAGLNPGVVEEAHSNTVALHCVLSQSPLPYARVARGTAVDFVLSLGPEVSNTVTVPDLTGMHSDDAFAAIEAAELAVGTSEEAPSNTVRYGLVAGQDPLPNAEVAPGTAVNLVFASGPDPSVEWWYQPDPDSIKGLTINLTSDGGCIMSGGYTGSHYMYALKLNGVGDYGWAYKYSNLSQYGSHEELWPYVAHGIEQTADGGYIMLGRGGNDDDGFPADAFVLVKLDANGEREWSKSYAPANPYSADNTCVGNIPAALQVTSDGGYVIIGRSYDGLSTPRQTGCFVTDLCIRVWFRILVLA